MNLALFPITALLLLLSGVGSPMRPGDSRSSATALIKAILGNVSDGAKPRQRITFTQNQSARRHPARAWKASLPTGLQRVRASISLCRRNGNRKAYRARFGFVEGAYQPQGPPQRLARA